MRCIALSSLSGVGLATAVLLAGCGSAAHPAATASASSSRHSGAGGPALSVTPAVGRATTLFSARFDPPASGRTAGGLRLGYQLDVRRVPATTTAAGCVGPSNLPVGAAVRGTPTTVALDPARLGGHWCPGRYAVEVDEFEAPNCQPGTACPQFIRLVGVVGRASIRIRSDG